MVFLKIIPRCTASHSPIKQTSKSPNCQPQFAQTLAFSLRKKLIFVYTLHYLHLFRRRKAKYTFTHKLLPSMQVLRFSRR